MERPQLTTRTLPPGVSAPADTSPLIIPADAPAPGRARPGLPLRREGPAKLTGTALYTDDLVMPGAWFGATIRSTDPHARLLGIDLDDAFDWKRVVVVTAEDIPGDNVVSLIDADQPVLVRVGGEIRPSRAP
jgi:CO/xanthine dehydrogenase Mo-binding subunit